MATEVAVADPHSVLVGDEEQLVTMTIDGQLYGIPILNVQDIVEPEQITPVPRSPSAIAGVLNLRGRIVTVLDLRKCLGDLSDDGPATQMGVTVEHKHDLYTLLVDSIGDVRHLPRKDFDKPPVTLAESIRRVCSGIFQLEDDLLVVLDVQKILDEETIMRTPTMTRKRLVFDRSGGTSKVATSKVANDAAEEPADELATEQEAEAAAAKDEEPVAKADPAAAAAEAEPKEIAAGPENGDLVVEEPAVEEEIPVIPESELISAEVETEPPAGVEIMEEGGVVL